MELTAVNVKRLYLQIAEQLAESINSGELQEGDALPSERELAKQLSVSRPTIREAITTLEVMGLVEVRHGSGVYVREKKHAAPIEPENAPGPFEILEARKTLEPEVVAIAANRITADQVARLKNLLRRFSKEGLSPDEIEKIDRDFHVAIAESTNNSALEGLVRWLWDVRSENEVSVRFYQRAHVKGLGPAVDDHRAILAALIARDSDAARENMRDHLKQATEDLTELSLD